MLVVMTLNTRSLILERRKNEHAGGVMNVKEPWAPVGQDQRTAGTLCAARGTLQNPSLFSYCSK